MRIEELRELYDRHERLEARYPRMRREEAGLVVRHVPESPGEAGTIIHSRLDSDSADGAIREAIDYFKGLGMAFEWKRFSYDKPEDLKERLARAGFTIGEDEALMVLELTELSRLREAAGGGRVGKAGSAERAEARRVESEDGLRDFVAVNREAWPDSPAAWLDSIVRTFREEPERISLWVAYVDGEPACASRIEFPEGSPFASLWGGGTVTRFRNRGAYTATVAARAEEAIRRGYRFLTIDAMPMSRPIVEKLGFRLLAMTNPCESPE